MSQDSPSPIDDNAGADGPRKVGFRERIAHFTWAEFACTQSTGGIAIMLSLTPYQFHGLQTAGVVVFILNLVLIVILCTLMLIRFVLHPRTIKHSFVNPPEPYFFGSFWLSIATSIICMERFGVPHTGPWLVVTIRVLFWMYAAGTLIFTTAIWVVLSSKSPIKLLEMNPAMFLMIYNTMLTGTVASGIVQSQPPVQRLPIIVAGITYQGLGWIVSVVLMAWFVGSLMENGLGQPDQRPGLFIPVGSAGFAIVTIIGCARAIPQGYAYFATHPQGKEILVVLADWTSIFLWLFAFWLFGVAFLVNLPTMIPIRNGRLQPRMRFTLSWWGMIFPNVGFVIATGYIGEQLQSSAIKWVATVMTILQFAVWLLDMCLHLKALVTGQIMWPGRDEDVPKS
ncbi:hypothetical protein DL764_004482 [Monosporascus ibericus]|uniref:C4-dicarboxylate transporter/malic acid transport protein n=1 Tax=Monosporascus ibericus TaxID=155417 RepID=A0A4Q4TCW1_9PEZI|nr:hypothetical protein DL764_004482 [Monosporascus ibericus]